MPLLGFHVTLVPPLGLSFSLLLSSLLVSTHFSFSLLLSLGLSRHSFSLFLNSHFLLSLFPEPSLLSLAPPEPFSFLAPSALFSAPRAFPALSSLLLVRFLRSPLFFSRLLRSALFLSRLLRSPFLLLLLLAFHFFQTRWSLLRRLLVPLFWSCLFLLPFLVLHLLLLFSLCFLFFFSLSFVVFTVCPSRPSCLFLSFFRFFFSRGPMWPGGVSHLPPC